MRFLLNVVLVALVLTSGPTLACRYKAISTVERVAAARDIYVGRVTGVTMTGRERRLRQNPEEDDIVVVPEEYELRVVVLERLKGFRSSVLTVPVIGCGSGSAELGAKVVVFRQSGRYFISSAPELIAGVRQLMQAGAN